MKKLNLDETWRLCLSMWRLVAKKKKAESPKSIKGLKEEWAEKHGYEDKLQDDCFFCEYNNKRGGKNWMNLCQLCPGKKVNKEFHCERGNNPRWNKQPVKFYNKLVSLNRKRLKAKK